MADVIHHSWLGLLRRDGDAWLARCGCWDPDMCRRCDGHRLYVVPWRWIRQDRRERRRELLRATRQRLRLRSGDRLRRRLAAAAARLLGPCWCDLDAMLVAGVAYEDGQVIPCPDCGYRWSVSCDSETPPHLIDCDLGFADEGHDHE